MEQKYRVSIHRETNDHGEFLGYTISIYNTEDNFLETQDYITGKTHEYAREVADHMIAKLSEKKFSAEYVPSKQDAIPEIQQDNMPVSQKIRDRLKSNSVRHWAGDNISQYIHQGEHDLLIQEVSKKFDDVLQSLLIDIDNDPNSMETGKRLAKMYVNEIMRGRYYPQPATTSFPNEGDTAYTGMIVIRAELKSICSHHHQPVNGIAYIGIIPNGKVIGLSKYIRIAQWCAARGTLQEELCNDICKEIQQATNSKNVGVYIQATHGCCENRGVKAHSSLTQTTVLKGSFHSDDGTKKEFFDNIKLQQEFAPR